MTKWVRLHMSQSACLRAKKETARSVRLARLSSAPLETLVILIPCFPHPTPPPTVCLHPRAQHPDSNPAPDQSECLFTAIVTMEPAEGAHHVAMETASVYNVWKKKKRETRPYERATPFALLSASLLHFNGFPRWEAEVTISAAGGLLHWVISLLLSY